MDFDMNFLGPIFLNKNYSLSLDLIFMRIYANKNVCLQFFEKKQNRPCLMADNQIELTFL